MAVTTSRHPTPSDRVGEHLPADPTAKAESSATVTRSRADGPPALLVDHVSKRFTLGRNKRVVTAVDDVSPRVDRGEVYGILGANGGGKSTLIRLVSTLLTIDAGRIEVFGHDVVREEMAVKRAINRVSVDAAFFKKLSPYENLVYAARLYGMSAGPARQQALGIWTFGRAERYAKSTGRLKRVG